MSKVIYRYNPDTDIYYGNLKVSDSYEPQAGESLLPVPEGLFEPIKHIVDDEGREGWLGTPKEEWEKANPGIPSKPTATQEMLNALGSQVAKGSQDITISQKMLNALGQQVAQVTQENTQMKSMINTLGQQVAQLTSEKGGN